MSKRIITDAERVAALAYPLDVRIERSMWKWSGDKKYADGWCVASGGLKVSAYHTLREALDAWINGLDEALAHDPEHFDGWRKFREIHPVPSKEGK